MNVLVALERQPLVTERGPLGIRDFGLRGRGVVALKRFSKGELIEQSPVLIIPSQDRELTDQTVIFTYVFMWEEGTSEEQLYSHHGRAAIALGYASLLNHSETPNCIFRRRINEGLLEIIAQTPIAAGDELTIDYQMTLWFKPLKLGG